MVKNSAIGPVEKWAPADRTVRYVVELEGAWVTAGPPSRTCTYMVEQVQIRFHWTEGQEEGARTFVKLTARKVIEGRVSRVESTLFPFDLVEVPSWLTDLIDRAHPRNIG